jgi:hypothetical protein
VTGRRCTARKEDGERCGARPLRDGERCFVHDPAHAAEAADARRLGGLRRRREGTLTMTYEVGEIDTVEGLRRLLEIAMTDALAMDSGAPKLRILLDIIKTGLKLCEAIEVEQRLAALEAARRGRGFGS